MKDDLPESEEGMAERRPKVQAAARSPRGFIRAGAAIVLGAAVMVGCVEAARWAGRSTLFAIRTVDVEGARRASAASIRRLSDISEGTNLFSVDLDAARVRVAGHPWIDTADVRLMAVDRVSIQVVEHEPAALVALEHLYYADATGRLFKRYTPGEAVPLAVVTGLDRTRVEAQDPTQVRLLTAALDLIGEWDARTSGDLAEVNVDEVHGLTVVLAKDGLTVALGRGEWRDRLALLAQVRAALREKGLRPLRIDLTGRRRTDRVVIRLAGEGGDVTAEPPDFGTEQTSRSSEKRAATGRGEAAQGA